MIHFFIGQARFGVHVRQLGQAQPAAGSIDVENADTGSVVGLVKPVTLDKQVVTDLRL
jgi:hypothetical protein